jgi:hypothetical protein
MRIRKEIRSLSIHEWNKVVDAIKIMKSTNYDDGQRLYGSNYFPYDKFVAKHANAALNPNGDQAHFGPVFPIYHRCWLLLFENCLLSIDPSIQGECFKSIV